MPTRPRPTPIRAFIAAARRAVLATTDAEGGPRLVPICYVIDPVPNEAPQGEAIVLLSPIDEKAKRSPDPMRLARVRDLLERPAVGVLVDRWDEDWARLAWVRLDCRAEVLAAPGADPGRAQRATPGERDRAIAALRAKYPQYAAQRLEERPLIRLTCRVAGAWGDLAGERERPAREDETDVEAM